MDNSIYDPFEESAQVIERIAETQGEIFVCASDAGYDMDAFAREYLQSDFCKYEMDAIYSPYQLEFGTLCFESIKEKFKEKGITIPKLKEEEYASPAFIGQMYRFLFFELRMFSNTLYEKIPYRKLADYSMDCEEMTEEEALRYIVKRLEP